jgi:integrase
MSKPLTDAAVRRFKATRKRREIPDGALPGLYLFIQPLPSGKKSWHLRYRRPDIIAKTANLLLGSVFAGLGEVDGREPEIGGHLTLAGARRLCARLKHDIALGKDPAAIHQAKKAARTDVPETFDVKVREFIYEHSRKVRRWEEIARILGLDYRSGAPVVIKDGLCERWGGRPCAEITSHEIYELIDESRRSGIPGLAARNSGISDSRGRKMADALGSLFRWIFRHGHNPAAGMWRPVPPQARDRVLNCKLDTRGADEIRWFWAACEALGNPVSALLRLLLLTGCRLEEIAQMTRDELNDDCTLLSLRGSRTKNGRPHDVPLSRLAREILSEVQRIEGSPVVFSRTGKAISGFSRIKHELDAAMLALAKEERSDAVIAPWRLHDLRRTAATGMAGMGISPHVIEACLNHVSGARAGVAGIYNREIYANEKAAALHAWSEHVERIFTGQSAKVLKLRHV